MYYYPPRYYPYYYYPMYKYAGLYDTLAPALPYLGAAGVGAGLGAIGGAGIGAWRGGGDWKKALKSALVGMVTGAVVGPAAYAGYQALFPAPRPSEFPTPQLVSLDEAEAMIELDPITKQEYDLAGRRKDPVFMEALLARVGRPVKIKR